MIEKILLTAIALFLLYELMEHVILPLLGRSFQKKRSIRSGKEGLIGQLAEVVEWKEKSGMVRLNGEYWQAVGEKSFPVGQEVKVEKIEGLKLTVTSFENSRVKP
ncbi:MAG: NfeD family protein [bacterium]|nr:MAG: NfeD family protein [bacterium]